MEADKLLRVLLLSGSSSGATVLKQLLPGGFDTPVTVNSAVQGKRQLASDTFDAVIVNTPLTDDLGICFAQDVAENTSAAVMMIADRDIGETLLCRAEGCGILTLSKPVGKDTLRMAFGFLRAVSVRLGAAEAAKKELRTKIDEMAMVDRAKLVLITYLRMTEEQAHRYIEKQSMDMRISREETAARIIKTYEN